MTRNIKIGDKVVGENQPIFVIAEAGVNHNGKLSMALRLIDAAAAAGADAVKFQTFRAEDVVTRNGQMVNYQIKNIGKDIGQLEMIKSLELKDNYWKLISDHCKKRKIMFLSAPHGGFHSVDILYSLDVHAYKIGSGDLTNLPLLKYVAKIGKPIILSTGMSTLSEIKVAIKEIKRNNNNKIIVLHCTTNYPCSLDDVNLRAMLTIREKTKLLVGYSDHTKGIQVPVMAATLGACVIEKHFTLNKRMSGPDHTASLNPSELKEMVIAIRQASLILGSTIKKPNATEKSMMGSIRKSIVASREIKSGERFNSKNLAIKRPGTGLTPDKWYRLLGKQAKRDYKTDEMINKNEI